MIPRTTFKVNEAAKRVFAVILVVLLLTPPMYVAKAATIGNLAATDDSGTVNINGAAGGSFGDFAQGVGYSSASYTGSVYITIKTKTPSHTYSNSMNWHVIEYNSEADMGANPFSGTNIGGSSTGSGFTTDASGFYSFLAGTLTITAGKYYAIYIQDNINIDYAGNPSNAYGTYPFMYQDHSLQNKSIFGAITDNGSYTPPITDTHTRIDTVSPYNGQLIATSSLPWTFETTGWVNTNDYKTGTRLRIKVDRLTDQQAVGALAGLQSASGNYTYLPITPDGAFDVSTSTIVNTFGVNRVGIYNVHEDIQVPNLGVHWWLFNFNLNYQSYAATSTSYTVGTTTALDKINIAGANFLDKTIGPDATTSPLEGCQFSWFSSAVDFTIGSKLLDCIGGLIQWSFVPQPDAVTASIDQVRTGFLERAPWGYATRFVTIVSNNATTTATTSLPSVTVNIPSGPLDGSTLSFDFQDMFDGGASLLDSIQDPTYHKSVRDIFEPWIQLFIAITVLAIIMNDLMHMNKSGRI